MDPLNEEKKNLVNFTRHSLYFVVNISLCSLADSPQPSQLEWETPANVGARLGPGVAGGTISYPARAGG